MTQVYSILSYKNIYTQFNYAALNSVEVNVLSMVECMYEIRKC